MPIKRSAYKELRKAKRRHDRNIAIRSELKTAAKKTEQLIAEKKLDAAKAMLKIFQGRLNRATTKGIIHKNTASRKTGRLAKKISLLERAPK